MNGSKEYSSRTIRVERLSYLTGRCFLGRVPCCINLLIIPSDFGTGPGRPWPSLRDIPIASMVRWRCLTGGYSPGQVIIPSGSGTGMGSPWPSLRAISVG